MQFETYCCATKVPIFYILQLAYYILFHDTTSSGLDLLHLPKCQVTCSIWCAGIVLCLDDYAHSGSSDESVHDVVMNDAGMLLCVCCRQRWCCSKM